MLGYNCFRPLTGIMFLSLNNKKSNEEAKYPSFRPLTGIMILNVATKI